MKKVCFNLKVFDEHEMYQTKALDYFEGSKKVDFGDKDYGLEITNNNGIFKITNGMNGRGNNIMGTLKNFKLEWRYE